MASLEELEARVAVLEAEHADYRAVLAVINALGQKVAGFQTAVANQFAVVRAEMAADRTVNNERHRSLDEHLAEVKDLLIQALGK